PVKECAVAEQPKAAAAAKAPKTHRTSRRDSDWDKHFELKKAPKIWQAQRLGLPKGRSLVRVSRLSMISTKWQPEVARRQNSFFTGKLCARPAPVSRGFSRYRRICDDPSSPLASRSSEKY